jgi:endonuclease V-like protein UPF0215 family
MLRTISLEDCLVTSRSRFGKTRLELRIVGVDDGAFSPTRDHRETALLLAVLLKGFRIQSVLLGRIQIDGTDASHVLKVLLRRVRFEVVMLSGISFGGFNLIDISKLAREIRKPVIAVSGEKPDNRAVQKALKTHFPDWEMRWNIVRSAGRLYSCKPLENEPRLYYEVKGATPDFANKVISSTAAISRLPEPIRVARILARGLSGLTKIRRS